MVMAYFMIHLSTCFEKGHYEYDMWITGLVNLAWSIKRDEDNTVARSLWLATAINVKVYVKEHNKTISVVLRVHFLFMTVMCNYIDRTSNTSWNEVTGCVTVVICYSSCRP